MNTTAAPATPDELQLAAQSAGMTTLEWCRRANLAPSVFYNWKRGGTVTLATYEALRQAIERASDA